MIKKQSGAVLIYTLFMMSSISFLTQQFLKNALVHYRFNRFALYREQATMLALGGINLAISQLTAHTKPKDDKKKQKKEEPYAAEKALLKRILPSLNRWQTFVLTEKVDGIDGMIEICLSCEHGKVNINDVFDFNKKKIKDVYLPLLQPLSFGHRRSRGEFVKSLTAFFKKRKKMVDDVSELLAIDELSDTPLLYMPPAPHKPSAKQLERGIALFDLFTVWTTTTVQVQPPKKKGQKQGAVPKEVASPIEPWLLSDTMCVLLGLRRPQHDDARRMRGKFKRAIKLFKKDLGKSWVNNWTILKPLYEKAPHRLAQLQRIFSQQFAPSIYTVLSSGTVHDIKQKLLAVLVPSKQQGKGQKQSEQKRTSYSIYKLFWV